MLKLPDDEERQIAAQRRIIGLIVSGRVMDTTEAVFSNHVQSCKRGRQTVCKCKWLDCIKSHVVLLYAIGIH